MMRSCPEGQAAFFFKQSRLNLMAKRRRSSSAPGGVTRRDFIGAALLGAGSALLGAEAPLSTAMAGASGTAGAKKLAYAQLGPDWTGPGGIGDYASSNGNVFSK